MKDVQSYEQVIDSYDIGALRVPADLQLTASGDIAVHDGDLRARRRPIQRDVSSGSGVAI